MRCYLSLSQIGPFFADMQSSPTFPKIGPFLCTPSTKLLPRKPLLSPIQPETNLGISTISGISRSTRKCSSTTSFPRFVKNWNSVKNPAKTCKPRSREKRPVCERSGTLACPIKWRRSRRLSRFFVNRVAPSVRPTCPRPCSSERRDSRPRRQEAALKCPVEVKCAATIGLGCKLPVSMQESVADKSREVFGAKVTRSNFNLNLCESGNSSSLFSTTPKLTVTARLTGRDCVCLEFPSPVDCFFSLLLLFASSLCFFSLLLLA